MQTHDIDYRCEAVNLRGYLAFDETATDAAAGRAGVSRGAGAWRFRDGAGAQGRGARLCGARGRHVRRSPAGAQPAGGRHSGRRPAQRTADAARAGPRRAGDACRLAAGRCEPIGRDRFLLRRLGRARTRARRRRSCRRRQLPRRAHHEGARGFRQASRPACWCAPAPTIRWRRRNRSGPSRTRCARRKCGTGRSSATATRCTVSPIRRRTVR